MKYKLIIADFDGTLAGRDGIISPKVESAIKKWRQAGGDFSIATGRQYAMIKDEVKKLGLLSPQITRGGAEIVDPKTGKVIYSKLIETDTVKNFMDLLVSNGYEFLTEEEDRIYATEKYKKRYVEVEHVPLETFTVRPIPKMVVFLNEDKLDEADKFLEQIVIKKFPQLHVVRSYSPIGKVWDVTSLSATKHLATLELMKLLKLAREDVVGVGDGYNDFSLLEACGYKVAMGNASDDLKVIADLVVPGYQEDGVAVLIEKLLE